MSVETTRPGSCQRAHNASLTVAAGAHLATKLTSRPPISGAVKISATLLKVHKFDEVAARLAHLSFRQWPMP